MKDCSECGNPIDDAKTVCPFCSSHQTGGLSRSAKRKTCATINLKQDLPSAEVAVRNVEREISCARGKVSVLRIIHGWGSGGTGGKIKHQVHHRLETMLRQSKIKSFTPGEHYSDRTNAGRELLRRYPDLKKTLRSDSENLGISFVEI
jgi:hypothetical protein